VPSRRLIYTGAVALIAGAVLTSTARAGGPVASGRIVVSGDTGANAEMPTEIRGSAALGY
jgi:hypothetical protein